MPAPSRSLPNQRLRQVHHASIRRVHRTTDQLVGAGSGQVVLSSACRTELVNLDATAALHRDKIVFEVYDTNCGGWLPTGHEDVPHRHAHYDDEEQRTNRFGASSTLL